MIISSLILLIAIAVCIYLSAFGSIKYHIKFYTIIYSRFLQSGTSEEDAIIYIVKLYLTGEPEWKALYMKGRLQKYYKSFDQFILDITLFHYNIHPWQQTWQTDVINKKIPIDKITYKVYEYLNIYKKRYLSSMFNNKNRPNIDDKIMNLEIRKNIGRLRHKIYEIETKNDNVISKRNIHILNEEVKIIDGIIQKQVISSQFT